MKGGVRKRGKKWYYYFDAGVVDGKRKKIERVGGITKREALDSLREALNEFDACGTYVDETEISIADFLDSWFEGYAMLNCRYNTLKGYRTIINIHIKPELGLYKLKNFSSRTAQDFINMKAAEGYSKSTLSGIMGVMSMSLRWAIHPQKLIKENPMLYVKIPKIEVTKKESNLKVISLDEFKKIIERFPFPSPSHVLLQLAYHTGMRGGEVCGLTWDNIDFENNTITVNKTLIYKSGGKSELSDPKTSCSNRDILVGKTLMSILKKQKVWQAQNKLMYGTYYKDSDFVCTRKDGTNVIATSIVSLNKIINTQLGIDFTFHDLRHTHATMLLEAGGNIKDIQRRLGHSKLSTTMDTYSHVTNKMSQDSVDLFESIIN